MYRVLYFLNIMLLCSACIEVVTVNNEAVDSSITPTDISIGHDLLIPRLLNVDQGNQRVNDMMIDSADMLTSLDMKIMEDVGIMEDMGNVLDNSMDSFLSDQIVDAVLTTPHCATITLPSRLENDMIVSPGTLIELDVLVNEMDDTNQITEYHWQIIQQPLYSQASLFEFFNPNEDHSSGVADVLASAQAKAFLEIVGTYHFQLVTRDILEREIPSETCPQEPINFVIQVTPPVGLYIQLAWIPPSDLAIFGDEATDLDLYLMSPRAVKYYPTIMGDVIDWLDLNEGCSSRFCLTQWENNQPTFVRDELAGRRPEVIHYMIPQETLGERGYQLAVECQSNIPILEDFSL